MMEKKVYTTSTDKVMVCPACGISELHQAGESVARCGSCGSTFSGAMLETLSQIAALPEATGSHPCECGHPEMRALPDGVFHCPCCGSEVLPLQTASLSENSGIRSEAYLYGWSDGLFGNAESFVHNAGLARWEDAANRLNYYQGHRAGRAARF